MITCNHIHLLIKDSKPNEVSRGMAFVSGCMGREYNRHNNRRGAFWEDRYQISIVESEDYLFRCFIYIDLNMVRAGAANVAWLLATRISFTKITIHTFPTPIFWHHPICNVFMNTGVWPINSLFC